LGEEVEGGVYKPTEVREDVAKVACGEYHSMIISN